MMKKWLISTGLCLLFGGMQHAFAVDRDEAAEIAADVSQGKVLAVEEIVDNNEVVFIVRVLTPSGEVRVLSIDAETGDVD